MELKLNKTILKDKQFCLLIVPYGIETCDLEEQAHKYCAFNRTLWN